MLYKNIYNKLKDDIISGEIKPNAKIPTEFALMKEYDVSRTTVRKAMNMLKDEKLISVSPRTGSRAVYNNAEAPAKAGKEEKNIYFDLVFPLPQKDLLTIIKGIKEYFSDIEIKTAVHFVYDKNEDEITDMLLRKHTNGVIIYPWYDFSCANMANKLISNSIPLVLVDKKIKGTFTSLVSSDNYGGMHNLTKYLIDNGHKQIAYISTHISIGSSMYERLCGYIDALKQNDIKPDNKCIGILSITRDSFGETIRKLIPPMPERAATPHMPTALICAVDGLVSGCSNYLLYSGYKIPDDVFLCSMDGTQDITFIQHPITTMAQDFKKIGECAAEMLLQHHENKNDCIIKKYIPCKLIKLDSSAK